MDWFLISWPTLVLLGIALRMALRLTYGARGPDPDDALYVFLDINSWALIVMGLVPAAIMGVVTLVGTIIVLLIMTTVFEAVIQRRAAQRRSNCTMLALLMERGAQLDAPLLLSGQSTAGIVGSSARKLFGALHEGVPLTKAVVKYPAALPREALAYLAAGTSGGAQLAALRELRRAEKDELAMTRRSFVDRIAYLTAVLIVMGGSLAFVMFNIMPEFEQIFNEFDLELPGMTRAAFAATTLIKKYVATPLLLAFAALLLIAFLIALCYLLEIRVLSWLTDRLFWGGATGSVLRILAITAEQRQPIVDALQRLRGVFPSGLVRRQMRGAATEVAAGGDWRDALLHAHIISGPEHGLLYTAERVGNLPWALRAVAQRREKRAVYSLNILLQVLYPMAIVSLGVCVGFYVIALFIPLVQLIEGLSK